MTHLCRGKRRFLFGIFGLILAATGVSACGSSSGVASYAILLANARARTVQITLQAGGTSANGGYNFNGYSSGAMKLRVPLGWTVTVICVNDSSTLSHSCAIVDELPLSASAPPIAFQGASTPRPTEGLVLGGTAAFTFVASRVGRYRITCLVPGHEPSGMWDWLDVTAGGQPSVRT